mgnify:CR=1 FL=1
MTKTPDTVQLKLAGVPETLLWPLWNRAVESRRQDAIIDAPWAVALVKRIDYDYARSFGKPTAFHPIRARFGDDRIRAFAERHGDGAIVVALGEGLDTQRLRVADPRLRWFSVDVPAAVTLREHMIEGVENERLIADSALSEAWMDQVPNDRPVFITALGLLMYFQPEQVRQLLRQISARFPMAELCFDTITPLISRKTQRGLRVTRHYTAPPMPWGISVDHVEAFLTTVGWSPLSVQTYADPFPDRMRLYKWLSHGGPVRRARAGGLVHAQSRENVEV